MGERLSALLKQLVELWGKLSNIKRVAIVLGMASTVVAILTISHFTSKESYNVLFTELSPEDANAVTTKLKELKVPYKLEASGSAVLVPDARVHDLRLELAGAGLPKGGGVGFEMFDKPRFGSSEFEQRIAHRRALEGELQRTISTIGAIQNARVHLVLPERSIFASQKDRTTASVVLRLRPGKSLSKWEIQSIVHLVSSAVPGLPPESISVVSADGTTLHRPRAPLAASSSGPATTEMQEIEAERLLRAQKLAQKLEDGAREMLEKAAGPGRADVRVTVELDNTAREQTKEQYNPAKTALRSEQKVHERTSQEGPSAAGVPGARSNVGEGGDDGANQDENAGEGVGGSATKTSHTRNWEIDKTVDRSLTPSGKIARMTVAVLIDGTYTGTGEKKQFVPRDREELDRLGELVKSAVGFHASRGDTLHIEGAQFQLPELTDKELMLGAPAAAKTPVAVYVGVGAAALALLSALVLVIRKRSKQLAEVKALADTSAAQLAAAQAERLASAQAADQLGMGEGAQAALPASTSEELKQRLREEAFEIARRDPASAAIVLREWLNSGAITPAPAQF